MASFPCDGNFSIPDEEDHHHSHLPADPVQEQPASPKMSSETVRFGKRKSQDELSDCESPDRFPKRPYTGKCGTPASAAVLYGGGEDGGEWSDAEISCLLDAYSEMSMQLSDLLSGAYLKAKHWESVAAKVSENFDKSAEQCKKKVKSVRKWYTQEIRVMTREIILTHEWPLFERVEEVFGDPMLRKAGSLDEKDMIRSLGASWRSLYKKPQRRKKPPPP